MPTQCWLKDLKRNTLENQTELFPQVWRYEAQWFMSLHASFISAGTLSVGASDY